MTSQKKGITWRPPDEVLEKAVANAAATGHTSVSAYLTAVVRELPESKVLTREEYNDILNRIKEIEKRLKKGGL